MDYILKDLESMKETHKLIIDNALKERKYFKKLLLRGPTGYSEGTSYLDAECIHGSRNDMTVDRIVDEISKLDNMIYIEECIIQRINRDIVKIRDYIKGLSGLECKIQTMRLIEGKSLKQIADDLGYSYEHIRRVASKNVGNMLQTEEY